MTDEERQRQMDFILKQQAQFSANIQVLQEQQSGSNNRIDRLERVLKLTIRAGRRRLREQDERIAALIYTQEQFIETVRQSSQDVKAQVTAGRSTDARLDRLAKTVDRYIKARGNGGSNGSGSA